MAKSGKRVRKAREMVQEDKVYSVADASALLTEMPKAKFDESVDLAVELGVDPKKAEENIRGIVALPNGRGKTVKLLVFCTGEKVKEAQDAGADFVGLEDLITQINGGWMDFDAVVATPDVMAQVSKVGKVLGPRGLMPNPKVGTVTFEVGKAVKAIKAGRVEYRVDKEGIVHVGIGRISFGAEKISENISSLLDAVMKAKPRTSKGVYVQKIVVSSTMGAAIPIDPSPYRIVNT